MYTSRFQFKLWHYLILASGLVGLSLFGLLMIPKPAAAITAAYLDAYKNIRTRLPDDKYDLFKSQTSTVPVSSSSNCNSPPQYPGKTNGVWGCLKSDNYEYFNYNNSSAFDGHQYITLSANSINDDNSGDVNYYNRTIKLVVYTIDPNATPISIFEVNRGIPDARACHNTLHAYYYGGNSKTNHTQLPNQITSASGCNNNYTFPRQIPTAAFEQIELNGVLTGIYKALLVIEFDDNNPPDSQTSFILSTSGARLGYAKAASSGSDLLPPEKTVTSRPSTPSWNASYPTNYASVNKVRFFFRPPCEIGANQNFNVLWQDVNNGDPNIQPTGSGHPNAIARVYKFKPDAILKDTNPKDGRVDTSADVIHVRDYTNLTDPSSPWTFQRRTEQTSTYGAGGAQQYAWMVEFDNIRGGNGMNFQYPYDSGDARIPCPPEIEAPPANGICTTINVGLPAGVQRGVRIYLNDNGSSAAPDGTGSNFDYSGTPTGGAGGWNWTIPANKLIHGRMEFIIRVYDSSTSTSGTYRDFFGFVDNCFTAICSLDVLESPGFPANGVLGGQAFQVRITVTNLSPHNLQVPMTIGPTSYNLNGWVHGDPNWDAGAANSRKPVPSTLGPAGDPSSTRSFNADFTAPSGVSVRQMLMSTEYTNLLDLDIGADCFTEVHIYEPFSLIPVVNSITGEAEDPDNITIQAAIGGSIPAGGSVAATSTREFYYYENGVGAPIPLPVSWTPPANPETFTYTAGPVSRPIPGTYTDNNPDRFFDGGDRICARVTINPAGQYVGPGGQIAGSVPATSGEPCMTVVDRPYVRMYGGDVSAGGQFGSPGAGDGVIKAHTRRGSEYGSGVEFAALALKEVQGFASANLRTAAPVPLSGLTFASPTSAANLGGFFATVKQVTDYYNATRMPETVQTTQGNIVLVANSGPNGAPPNEQKWVKTPGASPLQLTNPPQTYAKRHTLYVEGDVVIQDNIIYGNAGSGWANLAAIPNFSLIVLGNIYISKGVTQLDGLYVAQPNGATGGKIYTCREPNGTPIAGDLYTECRTKLKINGALIAQETKFLRTAGSLSDRPALPGPSYVKETFFPPGPAFNNEDLAAESINMGPELYLSWPVFRPTGSQSNGKYDYFVSLPPLL